MALTRPGSLLAHGPERSLRFFAWHDQPIKRLPQTATPSTAFAAPLVNDPFTQGFTFFGWHDTIRNASVFEKLPHKKNIYRIFTISR